jgi:hypothetical protein
MNKPVDNTLENTRRQACGLARERNPIPATTGRFGACVLNLYMDPATLGS